MLPEKDAQILDSVCSILMRCIKLDDGSLLQELCIREIITEEQVQAIERTGGRFKQVGTLLDYLAQGDASTLDNFASALVDSGFGEVANQCFGISVGAGNQEDSQTLEKQPTSREHIAVVRPKEKQPEAKMQGSQRVETGSPEVLQAVGLKASEKQPTSGASQATTQIPTETSKGMSLRCQLAIQKSRVEFVRDLDVAPTLDYLLSELILTQEECRRIRDIRGVHERTRALLDLLPQKGQRAFEELCAYLPSNQPWLLEMLKQNKEKITEAELAEAKEGQHAEFGGGLTSQQLQDTLRKNVLKYVQNDPSRVLTEPKTAPGPYLTQPITAYKVTDSHQREELDTTDVFELLEKSCSSGQRLFIQGTAGMGKSTLCREIGRMWAEGYAQLSDKFKFVLPIPLRLVRSRSLLDIICDDAKLLPSSCKERFRQEIDLNPEHFCFVLDSFEELGHTGQDEEIIRLVKGGIWEESTVLITTRPNPQVEKLVRAVPCHIQANLQNLTNVQVQSYMEKFPNLDSGSRVNVRQKFGDSFLQRPINLWLLCYVAVTTVGLGLRLPGSQTVLLNIILQHLLLAYQKKKNLPGFELTDKSPMTIPGCDDVKSMLKEAGRLCFVAVRKNTHLIDLTESVLSKEGLLELGLFAEGSKENTVVLPHQLFKEYLAALYLSAEKTARDDLTSQLENTSVTQSPRPCLVDMLRSLHLDNVVRFLVGLLPATANKLTKLFVVKQGKINIVRKLTGPGVRATDKEQKSEQDDLHSFFHYELDLFHECSDRATQTTLALALLDADITTITGHYDYVPNRSSHSLLDHYTTGQRERFLRRFYNCQLFVIEGRSILKVLKEGSSFACDSFVARFIQHKCFVKMTELWFYCAHLPVQLIVDHAADVRRLILTDCTLNRECLGYLNLKDSPPRTMSEELATTSQSVVGFLGVYNVRGLRQLTSKYVMPATRALAVSLSDVTLAEIRQTFPAVSWLWLGNYDNKFFSQETSLTSITTLTLAYCDNVDFTNLRQSFPRLETLHVQYMTVLTDDRQTQWTNLLTLTLYEAHVKHNNNSLNQEKATQILLGRICPWAKLEIERYEDAERAVYTAKFNKAYAKALMAVHE